jgi:hypothetical protein
MCSHVEMKWNVEGVFIQLILFVVIMLQYKFPVSSIEFLLARLDIYCVNCFTIFQNSSFHSLQTWAWEPAQWSAKSVSFFLGGKKCSD